MIEIREEGPQDQDAIRGLYLAAFEGEAEARIVDRLRDACSGCLGLVAVDAGAVVGHILFSPVRIEGAATAEGMALAPMAVLPARQREGIGSLLARSGLAYLGETGCPFVIVLGHPAYYPRFGFEPASTYHVVSQWQGIPDEAFMILVFDRGAMPRGGGTARYRDEFDQDM